MIKELQQEVSEFKQRPDMVVEEIKVPYENTEKLYECENFELASNLKYKYDGYLGTFLEIPVYRNTDVDVYKIERYRREKFCKECYSERLFDELYQEYFCPKCGDDLTWIDKKRRKLFMFMAKL